MNIFLQILQQLFCPAFVLLDGLQARVPDGKCSSLTPHHPPTGTRFYQTCIESMFLEPRSYLS